MKRNSGFTLAEVLVASSISLLVAASLLTVFAMGRRTWSEASAQVTLQSNARMILNQIARGSRGVFGLREANYSSISIEDEGRSIRFWIDKNEPPTYETTDDTSCRFYLQNERIWYDPDTNVHHDEYPVVSNGRVDDIVFTKDSACITIDLAMRDYGSTRTDAYAKFQTTVFLRKARTILQ
jgi:prepilin-type N-terminal cleavage/methylation domain-containing protein